MYPLLFSDYITQIRFLRLFDSFNTDHQQIVAIFPLVRHLWMNNTFIAYFVMQPCVYWLTIVLPKFLKFIPVSF